jgi:hypothetical protein
MPQPNEYGLSTLNGDERLALVLLLELVYPRDSVDDSAEEVLHEVAAELDGEHTYHVLAEEVDRRFETDEDGDAKRSFLAKVGSPEAREKIYAAVLDVADAAGVTPAESTVLEWLEKTWSIQVRFEDAA